MTADILTGEQITYSTPDSKVHGANMGPIWGRQDPGGPHVGPMNFAIWENSSVITNANEYDNMIFSKRALMGEILST